MMTKNSSYSRIVAVWLVLLAFLCGMIVPSLALAIQDMEIEMEGDPGDGLESGGGGGSGQEILIPPNSNFFLPSAISYFDDPQVSGFLDLDFSPWVWVRNPIFDGNTLYLILIKNNSGQIERGRN